MTSLNLDIHYFTHPKTLRLIERLGKGAAELPIRLWCHAAQHYPDGRLHLTGKEIEAAVGWWGKPGVCVRCMVGIGFLDRDDSDGTYRVHDWQSMNGHFSAFSERARKAANARWARVRRSDGDGKSADEDANAQACASTAQAMLLPNPTQPTARSGPYPPGASNGATRQGEGNCAPGAVFGGSGTDSSSSGEGGSASGGMKRECQEMERMLAVDHLLASVGVNGDVRRELSQRRDIRPTYVESQIAHIKSDPKVADVAAVLVNRLRNKGKR